MMDVQENSNTYKLLARCQVSAEAPGSALAVPGLAAAVDDLLDWLLNVVERKAPSPVALGGEPAPQERAF